MNTIAIPACDTRPHCRKMLDDLLYSIEKGEYLDGYNVVVLMDGVDDWFVKLFTDKYPWVKAVVNKSKNFGFARNANIGMRLAHKEFGTGVFVVNMDTILPHSRFMNEICNINGLATPTQVDLNPDRADLPIDDLITKLNENNEFNGFNMVPSQKFAGFCMWVSKDLMNKVGYLDEGFIASFEDDDICIRTCLASMPCVETSVAVHHYISNRTAEISTTGAYDLFRMRISEGRFRMKWQIPNDVPHALFNSWIMDHHDFKEEMKEI